MTPYDDHASRTLRIEPEQSGLPFALTLVELARYVASLGGPSPQVLSMSGPPGGPDTLRVYVIEGRGDHAGASALRERLGGRPANERLAQAGAFDIAGGSYPYVLYLTPDYGGPGRCALASLWVAIEPTSGHGAFVVNRELYASERGMDHFGSCELLRSIRVDLSPHGDQGGPP